MHTVHAAKHPLFLFQLSHATSLDMLETIQEETSKACRKGIDYIYQTVEFHGPVPDYANFNIHNLNGYVDENDNISSMADAARLRRHFKEIDGFEQNRSSEA